MEAKEYVNGDVSDYSGRAKEMKEFDETKAGVKGLVDSGITKIPKFFIYAPKNPPKGEKLGDSNARLVFPVIDFEGVYDNCDRRKVIVEEIKQASETWGMFQMVNHGIPVSLLDQMIQGVKQFHEQPVELKKDMYSRDFTRKARYSANVVYDFPWQPTWNDTLTCDFCDDQLDYDQLPSVCRNIMMEYSDSVVKLKETLSELLSEALGLNSDFLRRMGCIPMKSLQGHYYPKCPEPDLAIGTMRHTDAHMLTILLQDHLGGLQALHQSHWVDVPPLRGALLANIGDLLQLITNDKFKSVEHRVLAQQIGPRVSVATFASPSVDDPRSYGPINDLLSEENPAIYRETLLKEYMAAFLSVRLNGKSTLRHFKL